MVIVLGAGIVGRLIAFLLAKRGVKVSIVDTMGLEAHKDGGSAGATRLLRMNHAKPAYATLHGEVNMAWTRLEELLEENFRLSNPLLELGESGYGPFDNLPQVLSACGVPFERIENAAIKSLTGGVISGELFGLLRNDSPIILAGSLMQRLGEQLVALKVAVVPGAVQSVSTHAGGCKIIIASTGSNTESIEGDAAVIALGARSSFLLENFLPRVAWQGSIEIAGLLETREAHFAPGSFPSVIWSQGARAGYYLLPQPWKGGVRFCERMSGETAPLEMKPSDFVIDPGIERCRRFINERIPPFSQLSSTWSPCLGDWSPDGLPLIGPVSERVFTASLSGCGAFKEAPAYAAWITAMLVGEDIPAGVTAFAPGRLQI